MPVARHTVGAVFGRNRTTQDATIDDAHPEREGAKNRPTPKRRDQQAARRQPLVVDDRKRAKQISKEKRRERARLARQAMLTGDEKHMPIRDAGPVKRFVRDWVDARRSVGEFLLPVMLVVLALSFIQNPRVMVVIFVLVYGLMTAGILDSILAWRRLKKQLVARFGEDAPKGNAFYAVMRMFQMRRTRMPRPQVKVGQSPS